MGVQFRHPLTSIKGDKFNPSLVCRCGVGPHAHCLTLQTRTPDTLKFLVSRGLLQPEKQFQRLCINFVKKDLGGGGEEGGWVGGGGAVELVSCFRIIQLVLNNKNGNH